MHASSILAAALLLGPAAAVPAIEKRANPTDLWVTVNGDGKASTVTPVATTISGTPTILNGAPNELTGTVFTITSMADVRTSTGTTPLVTATAANGAGAFARCFNKDQDFAPFCTPSQNASMFFDTTYYVTWDPDFFNSGNQTSGSVDVKVSAYLVNATTGLTTGDRIDLSQSIRASTGFFTWYVDTNKLGSAATNVTLLLLYSQTVGGPGVRNLTGPTVLVQSRGIYHGEPTKLPTGPALYIGLPTIGGLIVVCVIGGCLWNRRNRKIGVGNIMSRSRHGYGIGESRTQRMAKSFRRSMRRGKDQGIQLVERDVAPKQMYRDAPDPRWEGLPRRDSDALGSLADSPTEHSFQHQTVGGGRNVFRDEMLRQERDKF